tara:strand:+ start:902 stop:1129 length:228 start_codon:yes stop_codon:yes gene_type:complete
MRAAQVERPEAVHEDIGIARHALERRCALDPAAGIVVIDHVTTRAMGDRDFPALLHVALGEGDAGHVHQAGDEAE